MIGDHDQDSIALKGMIWWRLWNLMVISVERRDGQKWKELMQDMEKGKGESDALMERVIQIKN